MTRDSFKQIDVKIVDIELNPQLNEVRGGC